MKNCEMCGVVFWATPYHNVRLCSRACAAKSRRGRKTIQQTCANCGKEFSAAPSEVKRGGAKFCSQQCSYGSRLIPPSIPCEQCGNKFHKSPSTINSGKGKFCSRECFDKFRLMTPEEHLAKYTTKTEGCWYWTGPVAGATSGGIPYGRATVRIEHHGKRAYIRAHRLSWQVNFGDIPPGLFVCHHCDNPLCVSPDHLFLGTHMDNVRDAMSKGRFPGNKVSRGISAIP